MSVVMKAFGNALGEATSHDGRYLKDMDFEAHRGFGRLTTTDNIEEAMRFPSLVEAMAYCRTQPACHPIRLSDGRPNRPMTAYNWEFTDPDAPPREPQA